MDKRHEQAETALAKLRRQSDQAQGIVEGATRWRARHVRADTQSVVDALAELIQKAEAHVEDTAQALGRARAASGTRSRPSTALTPRTSTGFWPLPATPTPDRLQ